MIQLIVYQFFKNFNKWRKYSNGMVIVRVCYSISFKDWGNFGDFEDIWDNI